MQSRNMHTARTVPDVRNITARTVPIVRKTVIQGTVLLLHKRAVLFSHSGDSPHCEANCNSCYNACSQICI